MVFIKKRIAVKKFKFESRLCIKYGVHDLAPIMTRLTTNRQQRFVVRFTQIFEVIINCLENSGEKRWFTFFNLLFITAFDAYKIAGSKKKNIFRFCKIQNFPPLFPYLDFDRLHGSNFRVIFVAWLLFYKSYIIFILIYMYILVSICLTSALLLLSISLLL